MTAFSSTFASTGGRIESRKISPVELTESFLARSEMYGRATTPTPR